MSTSTLTSKGQVTVPKAVRDRLGLRAGDRLEFAVAETGEIVVRRQPDPPSWMGSLHDLAPDEPVTVERMNEAVRRRAARGADPE